jgi:hypothetical protein
MGVVLLVLFFLPSAALSFGVREFTCNKVVFAIGDLKGKVLFKCGPPDYEETLDLPGEDTKEIIEWHFNCGERQFMKILTFKGGKLTSIRNGELGSGENLRNCR